MHIDVASLGTILGIWAHPDDEAYLMAGVMALAVDAGQRVACVTATIGDAGETADADRWPLARLSEIRREELERSLAILGVTDHRSLDLPDGRLADLDPSEPVRHLADTIDRVRPDTIITFGPDGMTGHPDHQTVSRWVDDAIALAGDDVRLLWATKTATWAGSFEQVNGEVFPPGLPPIGAPTRTWTLDLDEITLERKVRALAAHASQTQGLVEAVGRDAYAAWVRLEAFELVHGAPPTAPASTASGHTAPVPTEPAATTDRA
jgi:LmbE family N-acetylglucosaminyl deacetylase